MGILLTLLVIGLVTYFTPTWIAHDRKKANLGAIVALNLLAGWAFVGWVVALVWALTVNHRLGTTEAR